MFIGDNIYYPLEFRSSFIKEHPEYEGDLKKILERSGFKDRFCGLYKQRLRFLEEYRGSCTNRRAWFELLKYVNEEIYVIKFKSEKNIRILFSFVEYFKVKYAVLLYPFEEKESKKRKSKDCYDDAILIALRRLKEVLSDA